MTNSKQLAGLIGPILIVLSVSEMVTSQIWLNVSATQTYLSGALWFVAGLSIIRKHNIWAFSWPVFVTIIGWFALIGGLGRMFFPEAALKGGQDGVVVLAFQIILLTIGIILTFVAYIRKS